MSSTVDLFITKFVQWAQEWRIGSVTCHKLPSALRRVIRDELPRRDAMGELIIRELVGSEGLTCRFGKPSAYVVATSDDVVTDILSKYDLRLTHQHETEHRLFAFTLMPAWRTGFGDVIRDKQLYDLITDFFWLANQYVARSRAASLVGALAFTFGRACDFRVGDLVWRRYSVLDPHTRIPPLPLFSSARGRDATLRVWANHLNALDPHVHRAIFQYVRALSLRQHGFEQEALVCLDGAVSVAADFEKLHVRKPGVQAKPKERAIDVVSSDFGLTAYDVAALETLNALRNHFGAHPSQGKWWDFSELPVADDEQMDRYFDAVKTVIWKLGYKEQQYRAVEIEPASWSAWFEQNAMMLWDVVWFRHVPAMHKVI